ncbi:MAG TPA: hypothetical protein VFF33_14925 [Ignavibacteriaceae bacterium]|nr:hypothetical protein [Ignavibacteriaceae bacterium]
MYKIIAFMFLFLVTSLAQEENKAKQTAEPLLRQLSNWKAVSFEQLTIDIENKRKLGTVNSSGLANELSSGNNINILQHGDYNKAIVRQYGESNNANVVQEGNNNEYNLLQSGNDLNNDAFQIGYGNKLSQSISGNNLDYIIYQKGSFNELIQVENGLKSRDYSIYQIGTGARLIILNGQIGK